MWPCQALPRIGTDRQYRHLAEARSARADTTGCQRRWLSPLCGQVTGTAAPADALACARVLTGWKRYRYRHWREVLSMRRLRPSSEAEMVALFLRTELPAPRSRDDLRALLERAGLPERVVTDPDLDDDAENQARLRLLTQHRGYGTRTELFDGFPDDVCWQWMAITPAELARVRFIDYD